MYGKHKIIAEHDTSNKAFFNQKLFYLLVITGILINALGLCNEILEPDGTLYATIAKHIAVTNDWINLIRDNKDWLDKPHLPFWITAVSFKIFGINAFAYKFPSFIVWIIGVYYIYLLSKKIYNKSVAQFAVIIYITALNVLLCNFDVRAEGYLTTFIIAATYHIYCAGFYKYSKHIMYAAIFCACAMMTKGIFSLVTIVAGFIFYWIKTKQWKEFALPKWYLLLALSFLFTLPELYCLYVQFDIHPEKFVYGKTHVSGIKFFFWDSQFGRFFNNGPIKGSGNPLFFFHTILWAFLPWSLPLYFAVATLFFKKKYSSNPQQSIITVAALVSFIMFSLSKFQLPYYILIIFPHFAIITANWITENYSAKKNAFLNILFTFLFWVLMLLCVGAAIIMPAKLVICFIVAGAIFFIVLIIYEKNALKKTAYKALCFSLLLSVLLNITLYPFLMKYQAGMHAGRWLNECDVQQHVVMYKCNAQTSFTFYCNAAINYTDTINNIGFKTPVLLYGEKKDIDSLAAKGFKISVLKSFQYFHTSELTLKFLLPKTRNAQIRWFELAVLNNDNYEALQLKTGF